MMELVDISLSVQAQDGHCFDLRVRREVTEHPAAVVLCLPGMGVPGAFYQPLAKALGSEDVAVALMDLRGVGSSSVRASRKRDFGYYEIIAYDIPGAVAELQRRFPSAAIFLLGHSMGGQLICLSASSRLPDIAGIILMASGTVYHRAWDFPYNVGTHVFQLLIPLVARLWGYFPGARLGFGWREARRQLRDWSYQGRTGRYKVVGCNCDLERLLSALAVPVLAISFTQDFYAPPRSVDHLLGKLKAAEITRELLDPADLGLKRDSHFGWVKRAELFSPRIRGWVRSVLAGERTPRDGSRAPEEGA
ncbi:MAG: alpha/beta fold hydrolase [Thermodesulfobacteriota bacterium]